MKKIQEQDALWVRPPQSFIDQWNAKCVNSIKKFGFYNLYTGFCECNGLKDITYEQALDIDAVGVLRNGGSSSNISYRNCTKIRTVLPRISNGETVTMPTFMGCTNIEVLPSFYGSIGSNSFYGCTKLRIIGDPELDILTMYNINNVIPSDSVRPFYNCQSLEIVYGTIRGNNNIDVRWSPKLTLENFQWWIDKALNTEPISITVHPDVFSKLTDPNNAEWHQLSLDAAEKQIAFATV